MVYILATESSDRSSELRNASQIRPRELGHIGGQDPAEARHDTGDLAHQLDESRIGLGVGCRELRDLLASSRGIAPDRELIAIGLRAEDDGVARQDLQSVGFQLEITRHLLRQIAAPIRDSRELETREEFRDDWRPSRS